MQPLSSFVHNIMRDREDFAADDTIFRSAAPLRILLLHGNSSLA
jgi:hypothetical protein